MSDGKPSEGTFEGYKKGEDVPLFSYGVLAGAVQPPVRALPPGGQGFRESPYRSAWMPRT